MKKRKEAFSFQEKFYLCVGLSEIKKLQQNLNIYIIFTHEQVKKSMFFMFETTDFFICLEKI